MSWRPAFWLVAAGVIALDQLTKQWALETLVPYEKHAVLGDLLAIQLVFNSGAAFSLGDESTWILTLVALAVTAAIVVYGRRAQRTWVAVVFGLALGGAVGNLIDRLFRDPSFGQGHVVDMINYADMFVGNVADIAIVVAAIALVIAGLRSQPILAEPGGDDAPAAEGAGEESSARDDAGTGPDDDTSAGGAAPADGGEVADGGDRPRARAAESVPTRG